MDLGFQNPKTTGNAYKTRENVTTPQFASLHGLGSNWAKNCYKTGEKRRQKDKWYPFRAPTRGGVGQNPRTKPALIDKKRAEDCTPHDMVAGAAAHRDIVLQADVDTPLSDTPLFWEPLLYYTILSILYYIIL